MAKLAKSKTARSAKTKLSESSSPRAESQSGGKKAEKTSAAASQSTEGNSQKKVSQKLLETIEKRKNRAKTGGMFGGKPPGRRGRRPKNAAEYTPVNTEEDGYVLESDYEGIEYDTGIRLKEGGEDGAFSMDRFEDFDEELNFDR